VSAGESWPCRTMLVSPSVYAARTRTRAGVHRHDRRFDSRATVCGTGIEPEMCVNTLPPEVLFNCTNGIGDYRPGAVPRDPNIWQNFVIMTDFDGNVQWMRVDSYRPPEDRGVPMQLGIGGGSAAEWGILSTDGTGILVVSDDPGAGGVGLMMLRSRTSPPPAALSAAPPPPVSTYSVSWYVPVDWQTMAVNVGDVVHLSWTGYHNVYRSASEADYRSCAKTGGTELAPMTTGGSYSIVHSSPGVYYYICTVGSHCVYGQKIAITVVGVASSPSSPPPSPAVQSCVCGTSSTDYATYNDLTRCFGANDLTNLNQLFAGMSQSTSVVDFYTRCADYDNDGVFRANDLTNINRYYAGLLPIASHIG